MFLNIDPEFDAGLELAARLCGYTWGSRGNVQELLRAIARGDRFPVPSPGQSAAGMENIEKCGKLAKEKKPFKILYRDSQQAVREWHLRYAAVHFYEKRLYLAAWCEEDQPSDLPELAHNACFRFDRIIEVSPIKAEWRNAGLATATVHLALYSTLIKAYEKREEDLTVQMDGDRLLVERRITNSFWFVRSILPYGEECEILAPESVRTQVSERFKKAANLYA